MRALQVQQLVVGGIRRTRESRTAPAGPERVRPRKGNDLDRYVRHACGLDQLLQLLPHHVLAADDAADDRLVQDEEQQRSLGSLEQFPAALAGPRSPASTRLRGHVWGQLTG